MTPADPVDLLRASSRTPVVSASGYLQLTAVLAFFAALSLALAVSSHGFLEADATTHYLFARFSVEEPHYLVSVWGRPLFTVLYAIPAAWGGLMGARTMSLLIAILCALVTWRAARIQQDQLPLLAVICLLAQPLFFLHSFSELTELPFATVLILAFCAYQQRRWLVMAVLVSLLPLGRPEGFGFICLCAAALLLHRRWWWCLVLPLPLLLWSYAGWRIWGSDPTLPWWQWLVRSWPYSPQSPYGRGSILSFVVRLPVVTGPLLYPFMLIGLGSLVGRLGSARLWHDHHARCEALIAVIPLLILIGHSILWWRGWMASNGELRYMLVVGPFWALLSARGLKWTWEQLQWTRPLRWTALLSLLPLLVNFHWRVLPLPIYADGIVARDVTQWYRSDPILQQNYPRLMASPPLVYYYLDLSKSSQGSAMEWGRGNVQRPPEGTVLIWDPVYGQHNADHNMVVTKQDLFDSGWVPIARFEHLGTYCEIYLSPRSIVGAATKSLIEW